MWIALAVLTFLSLFLITVPYGRHARSGWGPLLNDRWAWLIMELPAAIGLALFAAVHHRTTSTPAMVLAALWTVHYVNRAFIYPFVMRRPDARTMPLGVVAMGLFFNLVNISLNGYALFAAPDRMMHMTSVWFLAGIILFIGGMAINIHADRVLKRLRAQPTRAVPQSGLFRLIACPNYLGEIIEWGGFALAAWNPAALSFFIWTIANLAPRARAHRRWYAESFPGYPATRKALVPWVW